MEGEGRQEREGQVSVSLASRVAIFKGGDT